MKNVRSLAMGFYTVLVAYGMFQFQTPWVLVSLIGLMFIAAMPMDEGAE